MVLRPRLCVVSCYTVCLICEFMCAVVFIYLYSRLSFATKMGDLECALDHRAAFYFKTENIQPEPRTQYIGQHRQRLLLLCNFHLCSLFIFRICVRVCVCLCEVESVRRRIEHILSYMHHNNIQYFMVGLAVASTYAVRSCPIGQMVYTNEFFVQRNLFECIADVVTYEISK